MSTAPIGYVDTVREDLLEAAWRSSMSGERPRRRRPSWRWVVAAATTVTLIGAGVVGWIVLGGPDTERLRAGASQPSGPHEPSDDAYKSVLSAMPSPVAQFSAQGQDFAPGIPQGAVIPGGTRASIAPFGDLSKVVKTGQVGIVVGRGTFGERFDSVSEIADRLGGYIQTSSTHGGRSGFVTMRVPAGRFQDALRSLRGLGRVESESVSGKDVTAEYVDLAARVRIALARRKVLFGLMDKAVSIEQTIRVQNALDDVQLRIEELQGALNVLNDKVADATIRVSMRETGVRPAGTNAENPSIPDAFDRAVAGFFGVIAGVIVGLGYVLPALALLALLWLVVTRVRRRFA